MNKYKKDGIYAILIIITLIITGTTGILNIYSYFNPMDFCRIRIEEKALQGNRATIKKAIRYLRKEDSKSYKILCKYVRTVSEKRCYNADGHIDTNAFMKNHRGCFVRGSKYIYIPPKTEDSESIVMERSLLMAELAKISKKFWDAAI